MGFGEDEAGILADLGPVIGEVAHVGGKTSIDPTNVPGVVGVGKSGCEACQLEAFSEGGVEEDLRINRHSVIIVPCG